jgi:hypothetical protein
MIGKSKLQMTATNAMQSPSTQVKSSVPGTLLACHSLDERNNSLMTKSMDMISEMMKNPKHPFRQLADRPDKPHKNRYERRKIRQFIQLGDWSAEQRAS